MLSVNNIEVVYNDIFLVLKGISLVVPSKGVVALLGANGAGKSTTLKAISGILKSQNGDIEDGTIEFMGLKIDDRGPEEIVRMGISQVPEGRKIFDDLNVSENILIGAHTRKDRKMVKKDYDLITEYFPILKDRWNQRAGLLSGGEQQMLAISRSLMVRPKLMMLDEPSLGLGPLIIKEIFSILGQINKLEDTAILLVEQNAKIALDFASHGYIMENGKIVMDDQSERLKQNEDVREFYLGLTDDALKKSYANVKHYKRRKRWLS
jgi:branched-chain amino acid transport system ATP-binding protein